ncbi:MAG TPA: hypothetical protein VM142_06780 [Acidimicrobiales bacterium]|nr:hypothetical protein [Acidimicrobiales bacterium]
MDHDDDEFQGVYVMRPPIDDAGLHLRVVGGLEWDRGIRIIRGDEVPDQPLVLERSSGHEERTFLTTEEHPLLLISLEAARELKAAEVTGWASFPTRISGDRMLTDRYTGFAVTGRCGPILDTLSRPVKTEGFRGTDTVMRGLLFDPASRSTAGIWMPANAAVLFADERVRELFAGRGFDDVEFVLATEANNVVAKPPRRRPALP